MTKKLNNKLQEILDYKRREVAPLEHRLYDLKKQAAGRNDFRGFKVALEDPNRTNIIAEVKKASPSAGVIREDFDPILQAQLYADAGAGALSILTDEKYFGGKLEYMTRGRTAVNIPVLRKEFIVSEAQIYESAIAGADAILLIVAALDDTELHDFSRRAQDYQLDVLVEVHDLREMDRALDLGADIIGINNRNLKTFEVSLETTAELAPEIPNDCLAIAESGIKTASDIRFCKEQGVTCFLIGETLMRSGNLEETMQSFLGA